MLKKLMMVGGLILFSFSGAVANDTVGDYADNLPKGAPERSKKLKSEGLYITEKGNEECVHYFNSKEYPDQNGKPGKGVKCEKKRNNPTVPIMSSPHRCGTGMSACNIQSGSLTYVHCTHTGGGPIHMDIYFGPAGGYFLGRVEDVGSLPTNCTQFIPAVHERKHRAKQQDQPVSCTGTCNFNYYSKP